MQEGNVVYFAHGRESNPSGVKIERLSKVARQWGFHVESPDYTDLYDADERAARLVSFGPRTPGKLALVGSSMGAYVSTVASRSLRPDGLFLMAPALYHNLYREQDPSPVAKHTVVVHGWLDEIIPFDHALRFARTHRAEFHVLNADHRLHKALPQIEMIFSFFLKKVLEGKKF